MGIKQYNQPCLRRCSDIMQGIYFLFHHEPYICIESCDNGNLIAVNLQTGERKAFAANAIIGVVHEGDLRISTDIPPKRDDLNVDKIKAISDAYEFCKGHYCERCPKRKTCDSLFGHNTFIVSQIGSLAKECSEFNNSSYDE